MGDSKDPRGKPVIVELFYLCQCENDVCMVNYLFLELLFEVDQLFQVVLVLLPELASHRLQLAQGGL